ncbi:hypothetical protein GMRT_11574 [Giardia muris]|uniref:Uncharacterized protein n=1 Tax=Giardia muris TaxID=5742 RepID=A0A4Z1TCW9_GIAMU|nr:hypothetical protein GMRT_11574 [Giardia muris]|eukprot:TNJ30351.1 hypothetical protein GMRT_11574 [Giardia muris]
MTGALLSVFVALGADFDATLAFRFQVPLHQLGHVFLGVLFSLAALFGCTFSRAIAKRGIILHVAVLSVMVLVDVIIAVFIALGIVEQHPVVRQDIAAVVTFETAGFLACLPTALGLVWLYHRYYYPPDFRAYALRRRKERRRACRAWLYVRYYTWVPGVVLLVIGLSLALPVVVRLLHAADRANPKDFPLPVAWGGATVLAPPGSPLAFQLHAFFDLSTVTVNAYLSADEILISTNAPDIGNVLSDPLPPEMPRPRLDLPSTDVLQFSGDVLTTLNIGRRYRTLDPYNRIEPFLAQIKLVLPDEPTINYDEQLQNTALVDLRSLLSQSLADDQHVLVHLPDRPGVDVRDRPYAVAAADAFQSVAIQLGLSTFGHQCQIRVLVTDRAMYDAISQTSGSHCLVLPLVALEESWPAPTSLPTFVGVYYRTADLLRHRLPTDVPTYYHSSSAPLLLGLSCILAPDYLITPIMLVLEDYERICTRTASAARYTAFLHLLGIGLLAVGVGLAGYRERKLVRHDEVALRLGSEER